MLGDCVSVVQMHMIRDHDSNVMDLSESNQLNLDLMLKQLQNVAFFDNQNYAKYGSNIFH
jgi:hypothetical protein